MKDYNWLSFILPVIFLISCSKPIPPLTGVDLDAWKSDHYGCSGQRAPFADTLREQKTKLLGLTEMEVVSMLGNPDRNELYKRNQKFYYYYLQAGKDCPTPITQPLRLSIRFNAVGLAKEVTLD